MRGCEAVKDRGGFGSGIHENTTNFLSKSFRPRLVTPRRGVHVGPRVFVAVGIPLHLHTLGKQGNIDVHLRRVLRV